MPMWTPDPPPPIIFFLSRFTLISRMIQKIGKTAEFRGTTEKFNPCGFVYGSVLKHLPYRGEEATTLHLQNSDSIL